jgi:hypothetical protein
MCEQGSSSIEKLACILQKKSGKNDNSIFAIEHSAKNRWPKPAMMFAQNFKYSRHIRSIKTKIYVYTKRLIDTIRSNFYCGILKIYENI